MPPKTTVLFQKGKSDDRALWDDSELIVAWSKQLDRIRALSADGERREPIPIAGDRGVDADPETPHEMEPADDDGPIEFAGSGDDSDEEVEEGGFYVNTSSAPAPAAAAPAKKQQPSASKRARDEEEADEEEYNDGEDDEEEGDEDICGAMPPLPRGVSSHVAAMLRAWYEAGFRTGQYVTLQQQQLRKRKSNGGKA